MADRHARASVLKDAGADPVSLACRRRLADGPRLRWLWAVVSALVCSGVPPLMVGGGVALVWQGLRRRTPLPALFGLALFGGYAFVLLTLGAGFPPLLQGVGVAVFAAGHHQGQLRAVRDGRRWLALDHDSGAGWPR